ncbi:MAG: Nif3-like dinuclear metal center hexameric protein [Candidatus Krumholzibacteriota bacterium]|nr:Nif3-like dinuclear metal center hexameric protein [Candidatus Krumholzibacteriota bacterium]
MKLSKITGLLDETLDIASFRADSSLNGLQVEGSPEVRRVALAVDACEEAIRKSKNLGAQLLIVHHGLFWNRNETITGIMAKRIKLLLINGISLYAAHLPLDVHPSLGNNARLASLLGLDNTFLFGEYSGIEIGRCGVLPEAVSPKSFSARVRKVLQAPVSSLLFGKSRIRKVGIVSGGGASLTSAAARSGCDALLTGETSHSAYHVARENRINLFCAGHYATETQGVRAVGSFLEERLGLDTKFIDLPTGL